MMLPEKLRRLLSPSHWMIRLLGLREEEAQPDTPGLILIQIDGLAMRHVQQGLRNGLLPFLRELRQNEDYNLWSHYSGIPSNTPSVQGEIFYGVKQLVPSFMFRDHETSEIFTMYKNKPAARKEEEGLNRTRAALLENGSSYGNIFSGGAKESHCTAATFGTDEILRAFRPGAVAAVLFFNFHVILRCLFLAAVELWLAVYDFFRGVLSGYDFMSELLFIPTRVGVTGLLREMITAGAKIDAERGLPIIHVNFFGYDEQSHRRGPSSWFAYWSLKGIDSAIRSIARTAWRSPKRDYEVWIYSDHGQEDAIPYAKLHGKEVEAAIEEVFHGHLTSGQHSLAYGSFHESRLRRKRRGDPVRRKEEGIPGEDLIITALGPLGFIYPPFRMMDEEIDRIAAALAREAKLPVVIARSRGELYVWTEEGRFDFEEGMKRALGGEHPYPKEVIADTRRLLNHPDTGDFVFLGWHAGKRPVTFPDENGTHGGIGPDETHGFALLPSGAPLMNHHPSYLVPNDIRRAALFYLNRSEEENPEDLPQPEGQLKIP